MPSADPHAWRPATAPNGAIAWQLLGTAKLDVILREGKPIFVATLSEAIQKLNGQAVRINGFMMPLEPADRQRHFLLLAYPLSCPFHLSVGGSQIVEVQSSEEIKFSYDPVLIEGTLRLTDPAATGLVYSLKEAHAVKLER
jgi:hypothetical protein